MLNLADLISQSRSEGYEGLNAEARVCQDIILKAISESSLSRNVTIKGGLVMRSITGDARRATVDIDIDFLKYSIEDESIRLFISKLNSIDGIRIEIVGEIEELSQQEYRGKRVYLSLIDSKGNQINSKMDLGVHVNLDVKQEEYCFDICLDEDGASLLVNSKEQIFTEKLRSLLRFGPFSTRYKDVFDLYYLTGVVDKEKLWNCVNIYILNEPEMREATIGEICNRVESTFSNRTYRESIMRARKSNWMNVDVKTAMSGVLTYLRNLKDFAEKYNSKKSV